MYEILFRGVQGESGTGRFSVSFPRQKLRGGFAGEGSGRWAKQWLLLLCSTGSASEGAAAVPCLPSQPPSGSTQTRPVPQPSQLRISEELAVFSFHLYLLLSASPLLFYLFPFSKDI